MLKFTQMEKDEKVKILKTFELFESLDSRECLLIADQLQDEQIRAKTVFIEQETDSDVAYFIYEGGVRVYSISQDGEEIALATLGPGEIVGEMAIVDNEPRSAYVETIQDTKVLILSKNKLSEILSTHPEIVMNLIKNLSRKVRDANERMEDLVSKKLNERTWKILNVLAKYFPKKEITLSQEEIAAIVGGTRARITEILDTFASEGKIVIEHRKITLSQ